MRACTYVLSIKSNQIMICRNTRFGVSYLETCFYRLSSGWQWWWFYLPGRVMGRLWSSNGSNDGSALPLSSWTWKATSLKLPRWCQVMTQQISLVGCIFGQHKVQQCVQNQRWAQNDISKSTALLLSILCSQLYALRCPAYVLSCSPCFSSRLTWSRILISFEPSFKTWCKIIIPVIKDHGSKKNAETCGF